MKRAHFEKASLVDKRLTPFDVLARLSHVDPAAKDWIYKRLSDIRRENKLMTGENVKKINWTAIKHSLSFGFLKAAQQPRTESAIPEKPQKTFNRDLWRSMQNYCEKYPDAASKARLPESTRNYMDLIEKIERKRLLDLRPNMLDRAVASFGYRHSK